jgi:zinicin-like metallopeptidase
VAASTAVLLGPLYRGCHQRASAHTGAWIRESDGRGRRHGGVAAFAHRVGKRHEVVVVGMGRQRTRVPDEFPAARRGDSSGMDHAQIPRVGLGGGGQRSYDGGRVLVDEGQRRHGVVRAPGPAAATGNVHGHEAIARGRLGSATRAVRNASIPNRYDRRMVDRQPARTRRGRREMRGPLLPPTVPGWRSRAERFDMAVLEAYEPIERQWQDRLSGLDVAVDEIPRLSPKDPDNIQWPPEVIADGPIALARLIPAGVDVRGNSTRARIVLFRKPIERRAKDTLDLSDLLHDVLVAQVATYLGVEPSVIDPTIEDD